MILHQMKSAVVLPKVQLKSWMQKSFLRKFIMSYNCWQWQMPQGYDTGIKIYNPTVKKTVPLILKNKGVATWYICGPTVYADSHIGHACCYVKFDIIRRIMQRIFNINVVMLMGVTDIDDKIINKAKKLGVSTEHIANKYELEFFKDLELLNVQLPTLTAHATDYIPKIIAFSKKLIEKDYAYVTSEGNVYFDVSKVDSKEVTEQEHDAYHPTIDPLKKNPRDFALWKAAKTDEPYWLSPWGKGRPGWHIECSTMASHVFGSQLDIHSGGMDLTFPHHANERSQTEAYYGCKQWVNYWLHSGLLNVHDNSKMSKSLGNTISIKKFLKKNNVNDFRIMCLRSSYYNNIIYTEEVLDGAKNIHLRLHNFLNDAECYVNGELFCHELDIDVLLSKLAEGKQTIHGYLADDFNTSQALICIMNLIGAISKDMQPAVENSKSIIMGNIGVIAAYFTFIDETLETFGVSIICKKKLPKLFVSVVDSIVFFRDRIRLYALESNFHSTMEIDHTLRHSGQVEDLDSLAYAFNELKTALYNNILLDIDAVLFADIKSDESLNLVLDVPQSFCNDVNYLLKQLFIFCEKILMYERNQGGGAENIPFNQKANEKKTMESDVALRKKKKKIPLLKACDEFRDSMLHAGIGIKDRKDGSSWFPILKQSETWEMDLSSMQCSEKKR